MKRNEQKQNRKRLNSDKTTHKLPPLNKKAPHPQKNSNLGNITHQDEGIVGLLYEYFIKNNFIDTLDSFQKDCFDKGFKPNNKSIESFRQQLIQAFEQGNREVFMNRFAQFVPISMRSRETQTMKLEFYVHVYFYVYPIHPQLGRKRTIDNGSKQSFISYLQGRGATLAKSTQFLQYYALAYLPKPQQHPNFKAIFTRQWIGQLKKRVIYYIEKLYPIGRNPLITSIYDKYIEKNLEKSEELSHTEDEQSNYIEEQIEEEIPHQEINQHPNINKKNSAQFPQPYETDRQRQVMSLRIAQLEQQKNQMIKFIETMKSKYQSLQNNHKSLTNDMGTTLVQSQTKWFKITQQFYNIANSLLEICKKIKDKSSANQVPSLSEQDINVTEKIQKKLQKYQSFIHMNIEDLISDNTDFSMFERPDYDASTDLARRNTAGEFQNRLHNLIQIDFEKVKAFLLMKVEPGKPEQQIMELENQKSDLLEALKQRIIKTRGIVAKRAAVLSMVLADLFNFSEGQNILSYLLEPVVKGQETTITPEAILRIIQLVSALAKDYYGREYLTREKTLLLLIVELLKCQSPLVSQTTKSLIIMTLQQLSMKTEAQIIMINKDVIAYIIRKLSKQHQTMPQFLMQYSTALLINLLLRKQGCTKSEQIKEQILQTLINMMEVESTEVREYVHGTLYPLFSRKVFREKAKQYGMEDIIKYQLEFTGVESLVHQLNYLQQQLLREDDGEEENQGEGDKEGEQDIDDICDEEYGEDIQIEGDATIRGLTGEDLLFKKYSLTGPDAISQLNAIKQETDNTLKKMSVYMANSFSDRPGTNNPVLQMRRNASHNNSVYSNISSNRILRSELNSRSQLQTSSQNRINNPSKRRKQKLDTVQPDNSDKQMSIKDFINENNMNDFEDDNRQPNNQGDRELLSAGNHRNHRNHQSQQSQSNNVQTQGHRSSQQNHNNNSSYTQSQAMQNQPRNGQAIITGSGVTLNMKPNETKRKYEMTEQYKNAFKTRTELVRTPPERQ